LAQSVDELIIGTGVLALVGAACFAWRRCVTYGVLILVLVSLLKAAVLIQDYRLALNQHYMLLWVTIAYLLCHSRAALKGLIVSFYVWAGVLKFNDSWLSGEALFGLRPMNMPAEFVPLACAYVLVLELVIVWGLLARQRALFWTTYTQFLLFHLSSFWVVGFFYPMIMFLLLSIFTLDRYFATVAAPIPRSRLGVSLWPGCGLLGAFAAAQLVPLALSPAPALTGEGRMYALNMLDDAVVCRARHVEYSSDGVTVVPVYIPYLQRRLACDPFVYFEHARQRCQEYRRSLEMRDLDLMLVSRRLRSRRPELQVSIRSFCTTKPKYSVIRHNSWIELQ
jgi:hypothetical protein